MHAAGGVRPGGLALLVIAGLLIVLAGCAGGPAREPEPQRARGLIVNLAASLTGLQGFELRTDNGQVLVFRVEGDVGITPGHAREHMVLGEPVTVTYRESADGLIAIRVED